MDILEQSSKIHNRIMKAVQSRPATYIRGAVSIQLRAVMAGTQAEAVGPSDGLVFQTRYRDILVFADEFDAARLREPQQGDIIRVGAKQYTVVTRADDASGSRSAAWRWSDLHETRYRIYVREASDE